MPFHIDTIDEFERSLQSQEEPNFQSHSSNISVVSIEEISSDDPPSREEMEIINFWSINKPQERLAALGAECAELENTLLSSQQQLLDCKLLAHRLHIRNEHLLKEKARIGTIGRRYQKMDALLFQYRIESHVSAETLALSAKKEDEQKGGYRRFCAIS